MKLKVRITSSKGWRNVDKFPRHSTSLDIHKTYSNFGRPRSVDNLSKALSQTKPHLPRIRQNYFNPISARRQVNFLLASGDL